MDTHDQSSPDRYDLTYFLGESEYQRDSSLPKRFAELMELSQDTCGADVLAQELYFVFRKYTQLLKLESAIRKRYGFGSAQFIDMDTRQRAAREYVENASGIHEIDERISAFILSRADQIGGKLF